MRLVTFESGSAEFVGALLEDDQILNLAPIASTMQDLIDGGDEALAAAQELINARPARALVDRERTRLRAPLPQPRRVRDCSLFLEHMEVALDKLAQTYAARESDPQAALHALRESGRYKLKPIFKQQVVYYNADNVHIVGPGDDIVWPAHSQWMDYELEWACVIGRTGRDIAPSEARKHIFGFTIFNDWSARDLQLASMETNLGPGEGKDFANGFGPCIATLDEFRDPYALSMTARVNGTTWSKGSTASMHHRFEDAIVQFSRGLTLHAGEIIGSGTVLSGCGFELDRRLADGDEVELEIEGIGTLRNRVVTAPRRGTHHRSHVPPQEIPA